MKKRDFYEVLGVGRKASADEIKKAYRKLARELHPDVSDRPDARERFEELQEAYDVLSDEKKREEYDLYGHGGFAQAAGRAQGAGGPWQQSWGSGGVEFDEQDFSSVFDAFFGGGRGPGRATRPRSAPRKGPNVQIDLEVDLADLVARSTKKIRVNSGGNTRTIEVTVPPGIADGKTLRVSGEGGPAPMGSSGSPGDLLVRIRVRAHPLFRRGRPDHPDGSSLDLFFELPLTLAEAVQGAKVEVPTLSGRVGLTVPEGTGSGKVLRLRGRGLGGPGSSKGDLYAVTSIVVPRASDLEDEDRARLEQIARVGPRVRQGPEWQ